jgi:Alanine racemase, N-terminal domain
MAVIIDAAAVAHNARAIRSICEREGLVVRAMFKQAYALPGIIAASQAGGIGCYAASSHRSARRVGAATGDRCALCGPDVATLPKLRQGLIAEVFCTSVESALLLLSMPAPRFVWLGVRTSDGRDGVDPEALVDALEQLSKISGAVNRIGLLFNWGCFGGAPSVAEVQALADLVAHVESALDRRPPISLGGSTLLPMLSDLRRFRAKEIRIGEAMVAGTIPGGDGLSLGLRRPIRLESRVVEVQDVEMTRRVLLDCGRTCIEISEVTLNKVAATPIASSSELSLFELSNDAVIPRVGERIDLVLGYHSTLRALLNRTVPRRFEYGSHNMLVNEDDPSENLA